MRIIADIRLLTRGLTSGIPGYTKLLVNELITHKFADELILFFNSFKKENSLPQSWLKTPGVTVVDRGIPNRLLSLVLRAINRPTIEELTKTYNADLVWTPHLDLIATTKTPHVVTIHDLSFIHYPKFFSLKYHLWSLLQNQKVGATRAAHIIAVSHYTKQDLIKTLNVKEKKITVIYPGLSKEFRPIQTSDPNHQRFISKKNLSRPFFLFFSTLETRKNPICVVRGFTILKKDPQFKDYELILAGRPGHGFKKLKKEVNQSKARDSIRFIHDINDDERVYLYNAARAFIFPSFFEGFGFPPLEAQACGIPVVSSLRSSLYETLHDTALEIDPWKPETLAHKLRELEDCSTLRTQLIEKGLENTKRFSIEGCYQETKKLFEDLTNEGNL